MRVLLISTVGTSLFSKAARDQNLSIFEFANAIESSLLPKDRERLDKVADAAAQLLKTDNRQALKAHSAEINGILSFLEEVAVKDEPLQIHHVLVATETFLGERAARLIHDWILASDKSGNVSAEVHVAESLRTGRLDEFRFGLAKLARQITTRIDNYKAGRFDIVLNLTGGFKGVQGFMQVLAMIKGAESLYIFETGQQLLRIPRLPIRLVGKETVIQHLDLFRRMELGQRVGEEEIREAGFPEVFALLLDGEATLSEWGQLIWDDAWLEIASDRLLEPLHPRIVYAEQFRHEVRKLPGNRKRQVNEAILSLGPWIDGESKRLDSEMIKRLKGNPKPPSTYELYAWSDQDTGRIFFHRKDAAEHVVIDSIGHHV